MNVYQLPFFQIITTCLLLLIFQIPQLKAQDPTRFESAIQKFEAMDKANPVEPGAVLFVGSSSIVGWKDVAEQFPNYPVLNRGFGGSQFSDLLYYADRVIFPYQPSKIFVYEGDNDISAGKSTKTILKEAKKLRKRIKKKLGAAVPVIFISPKPSVARWNLKKEYEVTNAALKAYTEKTANTEYADVWTPAIGADGKVFTHIFVEDNLHMNAEGYKIWKAVIKTFLP